MTDQAKRIKIAELCGWTPKTYEWPTMSPGNPFRFQSEMPDYLNDLNAMHEAEKLLEGRLTEGSPMYRYTRALHKSTYGMGHLATASERAEAFLRVHANQ